MTDGNPTIEHGDVVILNRSISIREAVISPGESGFVLDVDPETGAMVVRLDRHHPSLASDRNLVDLGPEDVRRVICGAAA